MRTIRTKVYQFSELTESAKQTAIRSFVGQMETDFIYDDAHNSVKAFHDIFGTKSGGRSWLDVNTGMIDDDILSLRGLRLQKYIWNNYKTQLYKGKYYGKLVDTFKDGTKIPVSKEHPAGLRHVLRHSRCTIDNSCVLTGVCYDHSLLQPVYDFLENYRGKADYYSYMDFETLLNDCFESLTKDVEDGADYQNSEAAIIEHIQANEYEFTKDGKRF